MKKYKLDLDNLTIDSFSTESAKEGRGTVLGHEVTAMIVCSDSNASECAGSCDTGSCSSVLGTCAYACGGGGQTSRCV
jgi:hypothetical protein